MSSFLLRETLSHFRWYKKGRSGHRLSEAEIMYLNRRLLGHRRATTTNRYAHLDDATLSEAAERAAQAIGRKLPIDLDDKCQTRKAKYGNQS